SEKVIRPEFAEQLLAAGLDLNTARKCLQRWCRPRYDQPVLARPINAMLTQSLTTPVATATEPTLSPTLIEAIRRLAREFDDIN
ncbi:MAG TPA: hypothetical protein VIJ47_15490, partial [Acidimicrobiales bacterium]